MSTYSVVLAVHIIAAFAAYGLPAAYPLILPYLKTHHPDALPGVHAIQYRLNLGLTGPFTILLFAAGVYLATTHHRWGETFTTVGLIAIAIIAVLGGAIIVPSTKRLATLTPNTPDYDAVYRRYLTAEIILAAVVILTIFAMAAKPL